MSSNSSIRERSSVLKDYSINDVLSVFDIMVKKLEKVVNLLPQGKAIRCFQFQQQIVPEIRGGSPIGDGPFFSLTLLLGNAEQHRLRKSEEKLDIHRHNI
ncbi:hypothetical protein NPIL_333881 [Nephila pilipes]|uniref:Uncharacterized protein n=1 Tax=Nephila pilipes TaxID=299642 RepID=A0A8X6SYS2_NEPPI|nr:hypothetical protein NPIL_333881 [Nephila pilipes]